MTRPVQRSKQDACPCCAQLAESLDALRRVFVRYLLRRSGRPKSLRVSHATRMRLEGKDWPEIYNRCVPDFAYYELVLGLDHRQARGRQTQDEVRLRNAVSQRLRRRSRRSRLNQSTRQGEKPPKKESREGYEKIEASRPAALPSGRNNWARRTVPHAGGVAPRPHVPPATG